MTKEKIILKGIPASQGRVKGNVKLLKSAKDFMKVGKQDIIVTSFLTPDFCAFLRNNSGILGIITDKGGSTCHAAILAREFQIPYIAGVKSATKRLKNNISIYLDAEQGIVYEC